MRRGPTHRRTSPHTREPPHHPVRSHPFCLPLGMMSPEHSHVVPVVLENGIVNPLLVNSC